MGFSTPRSHRPAPLELQPREAIEVLTQDLRVVGQRQARLLRPGHAGLHGKSRGRMAVVEENPLGNIWLFDIAMENPP